MTQARVAVLGGTGKTGRAVASALRARGAEVVPLGRAAWFDLAGALAGCEAAYLIAPNMHPDERAYAEAVVAAARRAGVARLVHHSVASPYVPAMPHHLGKARAEDVVRRSGAGWTILQPGAYLQNVAPGGEILLAMFAYYDRHGLPVGTLPMRALLGRPPGSLADLRPDRLEGR